MNSQGEHSGWDRDHGAAVTDHNATFESFLRSNGATDEFVGKLTELGFTSKLALSYLDPKGEAYRHISSSLNVGQQCLLLALIELCQGSRLPPSDSSTPQGNKIEQEVSLLRDMFPWHQPEYIRRLVVELGVNTVVELLSKDLGAMSSRDSLSQVGCGPGAETRSTTNVTFTVTESVSVSPRE